MSHVIVRVVGVADGRGPSPHDNRFVVRWDPHTEFGTCAIDTTNDVNQARHFADLIEVQREWSAVSRVQPVRPDGEPNRPLSGLTIEIRREA